MSREHSDYNLYIGDFIHCADNKEREEYKLQLYESGYYSDRVDDDQIGFGLIITGYRRVSR